MKSLTCTFTKESSGLKVQICFCTEIILHSLLLSVIVKELKTVLNEMACELLQRLFHAIDDIWLKDREDGIRICTFIKRSLKTIFVQSIFITASQRRMAPTYAPFLTPWVSRNISVLPMISLISCDVPRSIPRIGKLSR